jgi:hypothetical protein
MCDRCSTFPLDVTVSRVSAATWSSAARARVEQVAVSGIVPEASQYAPDHVVRVALPGQESLALEGVDEATVVEVGSPAERADRGRVARGPFGGCAKDRRGLWTTG